MTESRPQTGVRLDSQQKTPHDGGVRDYLLPVAIVLAALILAFGQPVARWVDYALFPVQSLSDPWDR